MSSHEKCDGCGTEYDFEPAIAKLHLFIEDAECNHVEATCPKCGKVEIIYTTADSVMHIMQDCQLGMNLNARANDELRERARNTWAAYKGEEEPVILELPEAPRHLLRELYDDMRSFEG